MVLVRMVPVLVHARKRTLSMTKTTIREGFNKKNNIIFTEFSSLFFLLSSCFVAVAIVM